MCYSPWSCKELDMTLHACKPRYPPKLSGRALVSMDLKDHRTMSPKLPIFTDMEKQINGELK